jgi:pSer/pThr/pTyr-binding forkhead associated (FHA) protein
MALHCLECSFVNPDGASYCQKCGAYLQTEARDGTTATYQIDDEGELQPTSLDQVITRGQAALVIRSGGGRVGESFALDHERMTIGRRPDSDVFLDDVTVSRDHALVVRRGSDFFLDDCGSLNGTYVNRDRIESHKLSDGDELQIGKYRLTFLVR